MPKLHKKSMAKSSGCRSIQKICTLSWWAGVAGAGKTQSSRGQLVITINLCIGHPIARQNRKEKTLHQSSCVRQSSQAKKEGNCISARKHWTKTTIKHKGIKQQQINNQPVPYGHGGRWNTQAAEKVNDKIQQPQKSRKYVPWVDRLEWHGQGKHKAAGDNNNNN